MDKLFQLLADLDDAGIFYTLARHRPDSISICITVPGQRIEIDMLSDGDVEVSRFTGSEDIVGGEDLVRQIIEEFAD